MLTKTASVRRGSPVVELAVAVALHANKSEVQMELIPVVTEQHPAAAAPPSEKQADADDMNAHAVQSDSTEVFRLAADAATDTGSSMQTASQQPLRDAVQGSPLPPILATAELALQGTQGPPLEDTQGVNLLDTQEPPLLDTQVHKCIVPACLQMRCTMRTSRTCMGPHSAP